MYLKHKNQNLIDKNLILLLENEKIRSIFAFISQKI
jgi:regulator of replication initiation timing